MLVSLYYFQIFVLYCEISSVLCLFVRSVLLVYQVKVYFTKMGNIYTVGPNEALVVSGRHINIAIIVVGITLVNSLHGKGAELFQRR